MSDPDTLRLISYNIQAGAATGQYSDYVTKSWRQVLPSSSRMGNLESIARLLSDYDIAGVQETDDGSLRTGFINQTQFLAERGGFSFWSHQSNRVISRFARTCNGILSRHRPQVVHDYKLPGRVPGRGALAAHYRFHNQPLTVMVSHLSLGRRSRRMQLEFLAEVVDDYERVVLMGDLNARSTSDEMRQFLDRTGLHLGSEDQPTFPAWKPQRALDHVMVSPSIRVLRTEVLKAKVSDHLPLALEIALNRS